MDTDTNSGRIKADGDGDGYGTGPGYGCYGCGSGYGDDLVASCGPWNIYGNIRGDGNGYGGCGRESRYLFDEDDLGSGDGSGMDWGKDARTIFPALQPEKMVNYMATTTERPVIVCTEHGGVLFGYATDTTGDVIHLRNARMAIRFGTTRGVMELAETGPTPESKISSRAHTEIRKITAIFECTSEATARWEAAKSR